MLIWIIAALVLLTIPEILILRGAYSLKSDWFGKAIRRLPPGTNQVALTFDDGPSVPYTGQILDLLRERNIKATFFLCGRNIELFPEVVRRIAAEGHEIGNHTYSHPFLYLLGRKALASEIDRTQSAIEALTGDRPRLFRPPYGIRWFGLNSLLLERGLQLVLWSTTGYDWKCSKDKIVSSTLDSVEPGSIILLHDGHGVRSNGGVKREHTVAALPEILDRIQSMGLTVSKVGQLED